MPPTLYKGFICLELLKVELGSYITLDRIRPPSGTNLIWADDC